MADKINIRISNKYDSYTAWTENNPVLLKGEIAIVVVPAETGAVKQEPALLMKVGDGEATFNALPWLSAKAADVAAWALADDKPTYNASEIEGLADYISGEIQDSNTQYKIEVDAENPRKFTLFAKELNGEFAAQDTIEIPETVYTLVEGETNGTVKFNGVEVPVHGLGSAAFTEASAYDAAGAADDALDAAKLYADGKDEAIAAAKKAGDDAQAAADAAQGDVDALAAKVGEVPEDKSVVGMIADAQTAATYDDTQVKADIAANAKAISDEAARADTAEKANAKAIEDEVARATGIEGGLETRLAAVEADYLKNADKNGLQGNIDALAERVTANEEAIDLLNDGAEVEGSVDYKIAQAVAAIMENPDETMNSINELVTWINGHAEDALELSNKVTANEEDIAALEGLVGTTGVADQIAAAIEAALKIEGVDKYALATDLTAAIGRIAVLEAKAHEHANKDVIDGITAEKVAAWDAAQANAEATASAALGEAKTELEGKIADAQAAAEKVATDANAAMNTRVEALEADTHTHANKAELDKIADGDKAKWDAAQANAEATAAAALAEAVETLEGKIAEATVAMTNEEIDAICNATIYSADEVTL